MPTTITIRIADEPATAPRRLFARYVDLNLAAILVTLVAFLAATLGLFPMGSQLLIAVLFMVGCTVVLAAQQAVFGNSAGKYIAGIKAVPTQPRERDFSFFMEREFKVLILGQAFGLQIASIIAGFVSLYFLRRDGTTHYDRNLSTVIRYSHDNSRLFWLIPVFAPSVAATLFVFAALAQLSVEA
ncbi:RDD family protein [Rhizobium sp. BK176]|uniref:RDD family protein n=1 Tax=Rhizobium sp. BK176 TaxID=2587071 RepID=UPI0021688103|nr:RDD family protein [Rhizobium sp. BK176]MCS4088850.1 hypothetical protein [Rhizobium sp. BK176]